MISVLDWRFCTGLCFCVGLRILLLPIYRFSILVSVCLEVYSSEIFTSAIVEKYDVTLGSLTIVTCIDGTGLYVNYHLYNLPRTDPFDETCLFQLCSSLLYGIRSSPASLRVWASWHSNVRCAIDIHSVFLSGDHGVGKSLASGTLCVRRVRRGDRREYVFRKGLETLLREMLP